MSNGRPGLGFAMLRIGCRIILLTLFAENLIASILSNSVPPDMTPIPDGAYRPLYRAAADLKELPVHGFYLDVVPAFAAAWAQTIAFTIWVSAVPKIYEHENK